MAIQTGVTETPSLLLSARRPTAPWRTNDGGRIYGTLNVCRRGLVNRTDYLKYAADGAARELEFQLAGRAPNSGGSRRNANRRDSVLADRTGFRRRAMDFITAGTYIVDDPRNFGAINEETTAVPMSRRKHIGLIARDRHRRAVDVHLSATREPNVVESRNPFRVTY